MRKLCIALIVFTACVFSGCGVIDSFQDRQHRFAHGADLQMRMAVDDVDSFLLMERSSNLTPYHPHVGR